MVDTIDTSLRTAIALKIPMRVGLRCMGEKDGRLCNHLLCKVDVDRWEESLTDAVESKCPKCGKVYTLADYR